MSLIDDDRFESIEDNDGLDDLDLDQDETSCEKVKFSYNGKPYTSFTEYTKDYIMKKKGIVYDSSVVKIDENGRRYIMKNGQKMYFTADFLSNIVGYDMTEQSRRAKAKEVTEDVEEQHGMPRHEAVEKFIKDLEDGKYEEEWQMRRVMAKGPGKPLDLSPEGIKKRVENFGKALDFLDDILPEEYKTDSKKDEDEKPGMRIIKEAEYITEEPESCPSYPDDDLAKKAHDLLGRETSEELDRSVKSEETVFGYTREEFDKLYQETNGFNKICPDSGPISDMEFGEFLKEGSELIKNGHVRTKDGRDLKDIL